MDPQKAQVLDSLKKATNILVTVSTNPSVDQLSAAIGLAIILNRLGKHSTAVFSGQVPSTMEFLHPESTLEKTTDSLRDFIIALDKSKADKLRYKVEDQMVKIFITPYRTSISDKDLEFSHGDFNVEVVIALGVNSQAELDQAITSHGRILHDATVIGLGTVGEGKLGSINWHDAVASSLCQMVATLGIEMKADVLDTQSATALLTGIVAETERFSNDKTTSETMQISSKLMTAGANQQLVASQLQKPVVVPEAPKQVDVPLQNEETVELPEVDPAPQQISEPVHVQPVITDVKSQTENPFDSMPVPESNSDTEANPAPPHTAIESILEHGVSNTPPPEPKNEPITVPKPDKSTKDGSLLIDHGESKLLPEDDKLESEPENQINIDDDGTLLSSAELAAKKQKINQTPTTEPKIVPDAQSRMITEPPATGEETKPESETENYDPSVDPLDALAPKIPTLTHGNLPASGSSATPTPNIPDVTQQNTPSDTPDSLSDLEKAVDSPHIVPPEAGVDSARNAVQNAVSSSTSPILDPAQTLNLQPNAPTEMPTNLVPPDSGLPSDPSASKVTDATAPPPVPPPMIPVVSPPPLSNNPNDTAL